MVGIDFKHHGDFSFSCGKHHCRPYVINGIEKSFGCQQKIIVIDNILSLLQMRSSPRLLWLACAI